MAAFMKNDSSIGAGPLMVMDTDVFGSARSNRCIISWHRRGSRCSPRCCRSCRKYPDDGPGHCHTVSHYRRQYSVAWRAYPDSHSENDDCSFRSAFSCKHPGRIFLFPLEGIDACSEGELARHVFLQTPGENIAPAAVTGVTTLGM